MQAHSQTPAAKQKLDDPVIDQRFIVTSIAVMSSSLGIAGRHMLRSESRPTNVAKLTRGARHRSENSPYDMLRLACCSDRHTDKRCEAKADRQLRSKRSARDIARKALQATSCFDRQTDNDRQRWHGSIDSLAEEPTIVSTNTCHQWAIELPRDFL